MSLISRENVPDIQHLMPEDALTDVTLCPRAADDQSSQFGDGEAYPGSRWKPLSDETIAMLGGTAEQEWREWQLYQTAGQTLAPRPGMRIEEDDAEVTWHVHSVQTKQFGQVHNCRAFKEVHVGS